MEQIAQEIAEIVKSVMPNKADCYTDQANLIDVLGFDSVNLLGLVNMLEERFNITFTDDDLDIDRFQTGEIIRKTISKYCGND